MTDKRRIAVLLLLVALFACKKKEETAAPPATGDAAAPADDAAAAPPSIDAPAMPSLGPPPAGMDAAKAAACEAGDAKACFAAAEAYSPKGAYRVKLSKEEADAKEQGTAKYALRGCELGDADSCALAAKFSKGEEQTKALVRACDLGALGACGDLGWHDASSDDAAKRTEGVARLDKACRGKATGTMAKEPGGYCAWLADLYGEKPLNDPAKAKEYRALACEQGYKMGCPCKKDGDCGEDGICLKGKCTAESAD